MVTGGWVKAFPGVPSGQVHFKDPPFRIAVPSHFPTTDIYFPTLEIPPAASVASVFITLRWQDYLINPVVFRHTCGPHTSLTIDSVSVVYTSGHPSLLLFFFFFNCCLAPWTPAMFVPTELHSFYLTSYFTSNCTKVISSTEVTAAVIPPTPVWCCLWSQ